MRLEHIAINVAEPVAAAKWYSTHLEMEIIRQASEPPYIHFLADSSRQSVLEIYHNPPDAVPDYANLDPLIFHLAFSVADIEATRNRLLAAGATLASELAQNAAGDQLLFLRDPWGVPLQLVSRNEPLL